MKKCEVHAESLDGTEDAAGAICVVPVRFGRTEGWLRGGRGRQEIPDAYRAIPAFAASVDCRWDDPTDRTRVYPQHVLETVFDDRWTFVPERSDGAPPEIAGAAVRAIELWQYVDSGFLEATDDLGSRQQRGRDGLAVVHLAGPLEGLRLRHLLSRECQAWQAYEFNQLLGGRAIVVREDQRGGQVPAGAKPPWPDPCQRAQDALPRDEHPCQRDQHQERKERKKRWRKAGKESAELVPEGLAGVAHRRLAEASDMPYVVVFGPNGVSDEAAAELLGRPLPSPRPDGTDARVELRQARRAAVVYPDAMGVSYAPDGARSPAYLPLAGQGWAVRGFLTDAVLLRQAQRLFFEDAGVRLRESDATKRPAGAMQLHRDILSNRARLWWPRIAREPWVDRIDQDLCAAWHLIDLADETFEETDQLAAEAEQAMTRWLTYLLAALAFITVVLQVPGLVRGGGLFEQALTGGSLTLVAVLALAAIVRLRAGSRRRRAA